MRDRRQNRAGDFYRDVYIVFLQDVLEQRLSRMYGAVPEGRKLPPRARKYSRLGERLDAPAVRDAANREDTGAMSELELNLAAILALAEAACRDMGLERGAWGPIKESWVSLLYTLPQNPLSQCGLKNKDSIVMDMPVLHPALKGDALRLPPGIRVDEIGVRSSVGMLNGAQLFDEKQLLPLSGKDQGAIRTARRVMNILMLDCVRHSSMLESHTSVTKEVAGLAKYVHMKLEAGCSATGTGDLETWVAAYTRLSCEGSANIVVGHEQKHPVKPDTVVTHVLAVGDDYHRRRGVAHLDESPYQKAEAERLRRECKKGRPLRMVNLLEWGEYQAKR